MQFYRRSLPHMQRDATPHFVTFNTKFRNELPDWAREIVLGCCLHDHDSKYRLHVAVVMPDHVHLILTPLIDRVRGEIMSLVQVLKAIKSASAHAINRQARLHGAVWQEESFDRMLRSSENLDAKVSYILENPVRAGLVSDWHQYPWMWYQATPSPYAPKK